MKVKIAMISFFLQNNVNKKGEGSKGMEFVCCHLRMTPKLSETQIKRYFFPT